MQHSVIIKDHRGTGLELNPVLSFWIREDLVPFTKSVVEGFHFVGVYAQHRAVIIVVSNQHEFSRGLIVLEDRVARVEEGTDHGGVVTGGVGSDANAREGFVGVWVNVFEDGGGEEAVD